MAVDINITPIIREVTIEIGQGGGDAVWGDIIGTLSNQTDLALEQTAQDDAIGLNTAKATFPEAPGAKGQPPSPATELSTTVTPLSIATKILANA